jgi:hypothetical protein
MSVWSDCFVEGLAYLADSHLGPGGLEIHLVIHIGMYAAALLAATLVWSWSCLSAGHAK